MSKNAAASAPGGAPRKVYSAYDDPGTPEEISRRSFMANASLVVGGVIGLGLVIPIVGSLIPQGASSKGTWDPLTADELKSLQSATDAPVKLEFTLKSKDSYLPEQASGEYVWGIKVPSPAKFLSVRPDLPKSGTLPYFDGSYDVVNMDFVIFSPICPHLGCRPEWHTDVNRFQCPCHGSQFSLDGEHLAGPAPRGMDPLPLREQSGIADIMWIRYESGVPDRVIISYAS
ncbi:MAG TPA: ubiquinol-cytochrome c reductase iron-sulfur subunit [Candidatus Baltobacteraceae bacterium]|nr:ubiquinol-cytochrome c reductase iron-sulfur subunit [Candidatus Baltobacteraceae bacterium]